MNLKKIIFFVDQERVLAYSAKGSQLKTSDSFYETIDPSSPSSLTSLIQKALNKFHYNRHEIFFYFNLPSSIIKEVSLPDNENLTREILQLNIERFTPFSEDQVSFLMMPSSHKNKGILFATSQKVIDTFSQALIEAQAFSAHISFFEWAYSTYLTDQISSFKNKNILLIQSNSSESLSISIFSKGTLCLSKTISFSLPTTLPSSEFEDPKWHELIKEVQPLQKYYSVILKGDPLKSICLWGSSLNYDEAYNFISSQLSLTPDKVQFQDSPFPLLASYKPLFKPNKESYFFIQNNDLLTYKNLFKIKTLTILQLSISFALIILFFLSSSLLTQLQKKLTTYQNKVSSIKKVEKRLSQQKQLYTLLSQYKTESSIFLEVLSSIVSHFNSCSKFKSIHINKDGTFDLSLETKDKDLITQIIQENKAFQNISLSFQKDPKTDSPTPYYIATIQGPFTRDLSNQYGQ